jgi:hypothetical protein
MATPSATASSVAIEGSVSSVTTEVARQSWTRARPGAEVAVAVGVGDDDGEVVAGVVAEVEGLGGGGENDGGRLGRRVGAGDEGGGDDGERQDAGGGGDGGRGEPGGDIEEREMDGAHGGSYWIVIGEVPISIAAMPLVALSM